MIPRRKITYCGIVIEEMDLDAILSCRPHVVLVDELAHTNVPGSKNAKRYQDVEEILAAGIHVISTLNIQHLESLYETVERATGVKVRERIPDHIVADSDQLVNVDVTTEDLRRRLEEGKVYTTERIETALKNFFKPVNLEQLRELTLRELAAQIDSRQRDSHPADRPSSPDQIMVCLSSRGSNSDALLRYTSRLAGRLNRNWYAVYVQTSQEHPTVINATTQRILSNTLTLAQQLGATVFTYKGDDIVKTILQFAKEYRVGHVVIGAPSRKVPFWRRLIGEVSILERLIAESTGLTLVIFDSKTIPDDRQTTEFSRHTEGAFPNSEETQIQEGALVLSNAPVLIWTNPLQKEQAIRLLVDVCCHAGTTIQEQAWEALTAREQQGGTFVGDDVAIPHARISGLPQPLVAIGIGKGGIHDSQVDRSVKFMFLLLSPMRSPEKHLELLALLSRMARSDQWRKNVLAAINSRDVIRVIHDWEKEQRQ
jgi:two-component system sensor histidine kinase KdpD